MIIPSLLSSSKKRVSKLLTGEKNVLFTNEYLYEKLEKINKNYKTVLEEDLLILLINKLIISDDDVTFIPDWNKFITTIDLMSKIKRR